ANKCDSIMRTRKGVRLIMKASAVGLVATIGFVRTASAQEIISFPGDLPTQGLDHRPLKAKARVTRRGPWARSKVTVKRRDKHQLTGRIILVDDYSFQLRVEPAFLDDLEPAKGTVLRIPYSDVEKIRGARSRPANVLISVGVVAAAVVALAAIAVMRADLC